MKKIVLCMLVFIAIINCKLNAQLKVISGGNVGINSTTPDNKLEVSGGDINAATSTNGYKIGGAYVLRHGGNTNDIFVGIGAGNSTMSGHGNIVAGWYAGNSLTSGSNNIFCGYEAGRYDSSGHDNSFFGYRAGKANLQGDYLTAIGFNAATANTTGDYNTMVGSTAGATNTTGAWNTFLGYGSGSYNLSADSNVCVGHNAGYYNSTGNGNTICGVTAGRGSSGSSYSKNSFFGNCAGYFAQDGNNNTAIGYKAGYAITSGDNNTYLGSGADINNGTFYNSTAIGYNALGSASDAVYLGDGNISGVYCHNGYFSSSDGRFKENVVENVKGLELINKLRPVTYQVNTKALTEFKLQNVPDSIKNLYLDNVDFTISKNKIRTGFIAQEMELSFNEIGLVSDIVHTPENNADPYAINYAQLVVPLVKAVQELSATIDSLEAQPAKREAQNIESLMQEMEKLKELVNQCCTANPSNSFDKNTGENNTGNKGVKVDLTNNNDVILYQNEPNPFSNQTIIRYFIPGSITSAFVVFYDEFGREVKKVEVSEKGFGKIEANTENLASGIYTYSIVVEGKVIDTKKMLKNN